ncbi:MAG: HAMP domain-containing methyl-accepting chemotaxis protein [Pseudomonadota bacterium]
MSALQEIAVDLEAERVANEAHANFGHEVRYGTGSGALANWLGGLSIGRKIRVFYLGNLCLALLVGLAVIIAYVELGNRAEQIAQSHDNAMMAERLVSVLSEAQRHAEMLVASGETPRAEAALEELERADEKIAELNAKFVGQNVDALDSLALIKASADDFRRQIGAFDPQEQNAFRSESQAIEVRATGRVSLDTARDLAQKLSDKASASSDAGAALISTSMIVWIGFAGLLTIVTLLTQRYFDRNVGAAIKGMTAEMRKLASGDNDVTISGKDRRDELGDMARAMAIFHRAGKRLEKMAKERAAKAKAELDEQSRLQEQHEEARLERDRMLRDVANQFESTVAEVVSGVAEASSQLHTTSQMMAQTADDSSQRTAEVSASMAEANSGATAAAAASDEFAMSISEISRQAASSAELARRATHSATKADTTISALSDSAQQVGQIVELIQTIAQRTNLLALNASIEAARGGEAGRGFAVVASEVKELAMQTSRATEQVAEQIRSMQDTTGASVTALRTIADQIQELETTAVSIASAVDQQSVAGQDLARSIDMAARGTEQVANHIDDVRDLSLSTGSAASQVLASSTNLESQAASLRGHVNAFLAKVRAPA